MIASTVQVGELAESYHHDGKICLSSSNFLPRENITCTAQAASHREKSYRPSVSLSSRSLVSVIVVNDSGNFGKMFTAAKMVCLAK